MRTVTVLFTDLVGHTDLYHRLGDNAAETLVQTHFSILRECITRFGGDEVKSVGDQLMVVFGSATDAVRASQQMQIAQDQFNQIHPHRALGLRVAINSGEPIQDGNDWFGTPVIVAQRLCARAMAGQILASESVRLLVREMLQSQFIDEGVIELKGMSIPTQVFSIEWEVVVESSLVGVGEDEVVQVSKDLQDARNEFFETLLSSDVTGAASINYYTEQRALFWSAQLRGMSDELVAFKNFVVGQGLNKEVRGKRWLTAIEASLGDVLTRTLPRDQLRANPEFALTHLERMALSIETEGELAPHLKLAWAAMLRKGGEVAASAGLSSKRVTRLLARSFLECQEARSALASTDVLQVHAAGELMAVTADIQILAPSLGPELFDDRHTFAAAYEEGRRVAAVLGSKASHIAPLLLEFNVRWTIRTALAGRSTGRQFLPNAKLHELDDDLTGADQLIEEATRSAGILEINSAVTRVNLLRAAGSEIPEDLRKRATRLVSRAGDSEQAYRLRHGAQSRWY